MPDPTPSAESYGTVEGVEALARMWTDADSTFQDKTVYTTGTNPQRTTVVNWIDQVSASLNIALGKYGFVVPLTTDRGKSAASAIVEQLVADLVSFVNRKGRFFSEKFSESGRSMWGTIRSDLDNWVIEFSPGLVNAGEDQNESPVDSIGYRNTDEAGNETFPIFQRNGFGNRFDNWTK